MVAGNSPWARGNRRGVTHPHNSDTRFLDLYLTPGVFETAIQLIGWPEPRYGDSFVVSTAPDRERETEREMLSDASKWPWHRDQRPRWNTFADESDPRFLTSSVVTLVTFFTPPSRENGVTAFFDASHTIEGNWPTSLETYEALADQCEIVFPTGGAGSMLFFSEALVHAAPHVLSDQRRVCHFAWFNAPWLAAAESVTPEARPHLLERYADERLKKYFELPAAGSLQLGEAY